MNHIGSPLNDYRLLIKRFLDIIFGSFFLICSIPFIIAFGALIKLTSKGPVFYKQIRVGYMGKNFKIIKLRSMKQHAERETGPTWAFKNDPRITKIGWFMRRTKIDELPQFWNVLKGDMSIVGPRPERPYFTEQFYEKNYKFPRRLEIKPGITGYAQVNGGYNIGPNLKSKLDRYYINHYSLHLDLMIIIKTLLMILTGHGTR